MTKLREPKTDCINYSYTESLDKEGCRGLKELLCATGLNGCPFYKSIEKYYPDGRPRKG